MDISATTSSPKRSSQLAAPATRNVVPINRRADAG